MRTPSTILSGLALIGVIVLGVLLTSQLDRIQVQIRTTHQASSVLSPDPELLGIQQIRSTLDDIGSQLDSIGAAIGALETSLANSDNREVLDSIDSVHAAVSDLQFEVSLVCTVVGC